MDCKLKYYLAQIAGLKKPNETDTEIDYAMFGTLFHKSAELAYNELASKDGGIITREAIESLLNDKKRLIGFVQDAFTIDYFDKKKIALADYSGIQSINYEVIAQYLRQILQMDADLYAPFKYEASESKQYELPIQVDDPLNKGSQYTVRLKGIIDRMDSKDGILRIVDYKTGKDKGTPKSINDLFPPTKYKYRNSQAFQILYYAYIMSHQAKYSAHKLAPVLLFTRSSSKPTKEDIYFSIGNNVIYDFKTQCGQEFEEKLKNTISELFNPDIAFYPTDDEEACKNCDFKNLCGRN